MDISDINTADIYHVILAKDNSHKVEFDVSPFLAKEILNNIHDLMGDFSNNKFLPLDSIKNNIETLDDLVIKINDDHGPWGHFKHKDIFDTYSDLGYDLESFNKGSYIDALNKVIKNILFLKEIIIEKEEDKNGK